MREIKYRAWDKKQTGLFIGFIYQEEKSLHEYFQELYEYERDYNCCFELMQSTGLQDKNGLEIWEGDIIHVTYSNDKCPKCGYHDLDERDYIVHWVDSEGSWIAECGEKDQANYNYLLPYGWKSRAEVAGNIFDVP